MDIPQLSFLCRDMVIRILGSLNDSRRTFTAWYRIIIRNFSSYKQFPFREKLFRLFSVANNSIDRIGIDICIVALERSFCPRSREQSGSFTDDGERMPFLSTSAFTRFYKDKIIFPNWNGCHFPKENKDYSKNAIKLVLFFNFRKVFFFKSSLLHFCSILR